MLTITDSAGLIIRNTLEANRQADGDVFRVRYVGSDLALSMDQQQEGDTVIQHQGQAILALERSVVDALRDVTIDTDAPDGAQLVIKSADDDERQT